MHDPGGEYIAEQQGKTCWILFTEGIGHNPGDLGGRDYTPWSNKGHGVIVRLNNGYGTEGTLPYVADYPNFVQRVKNFVAASQGVHIWQVGNECNLDGEWPSYSGPVEPITPANYVQCFGMVRNAIKSLSGHANDQVLVQPSGGVPVGGTYDPYNYWQSIVQSLNGKYDGLTIHSYASGQDPNLINSEPYFHNYRTFLGMFKQIVQQQALGSSYLSLPVYITEGGTAFWNNVNNGFVKACYADVNAWNTTAGNQQVRCICLFRWPAISGDPSPWAISNKPGVQQDWRESMAYNYQWSGSSVTPPPPTSLPDVVVDSVAISPAAPAVGQAATFSCVVRNAGAGPTPTGVQIGVGYLVDGAQVGWGVVSGPLAAGASVTIGTGSAPWTATSGTHTLVANADDVNRFAESNEGNNTKSVSFTVGSTTPPPPSGPTGDPTVLADGTLHWEAENYTGGTAAVAGVDCYDSTAGNSGGQYRTQDVDIEACAEGGYNVGWTAAGEWMRYRFTGGGTYKVAVRYAGMGAGTAHVEVDGVNVSGPIAMPATGAWQTWATAYGNTFTLASAAHTVRFVEDSSSFNVNYFEFKPATAPPPPTSGNLLANGDFEGTFGTNGVASGWTPWSSSWSNPVAFAKVTSPVQGGAGAQRWGRADALAVHGGLAQGFATTAGTSYTITAYLRFQATDPGAWLEAGYDLTGQSTNGEASSVVYTKLQAGGQNTWLAYTKTVAATGSRIAFFVKFGQFNQTGTGPSWAYVDSATAVAAGTAPPPSGSPDLVVDSVALSPSAPTAGQTVNFTAVVRNAGTVATPSGVVVGVGFKIDGTQVSSGTVTGPLAAGATASITSQAGPWTATSGSHTLLAIVDDVNRIAESNETNNTRSVSFSVGSTTPPPTTGNLLANGDFEGTFGTNGVATGWTPWSSSWSNPIAFAKVTSPVQGGAAAQRWGRADALRVHGGLAQGFATAAGTSYAITASLRFQSTDPGAWLEAGYDLTGQSTNGEASSVVYTKLEAGGQNAWLTYSKTVAATGSRIAFFVKFGQYNQTGTGPSWAYVDSATATATTAAPPPTALPDMVIDSLTLSPSAPTAGQTVNFTAVVRNAGTAATPSGVLVGVGFKIDGTQVSSGVVTGPLAAGTSATITSQAGPWTATSGSHTLLAIVDDVNRFAESNETNNTRSVTFSVGSATPPPTGGNLYGVNIDPMNPAGNPSPSAIRTLHATWVRIEFKAGGGFGFYDPIIANYRSTGVKVLLLVDYTSPTTGKPASNASSATWSTYLNNAFIPAVTSIAQHYGNNVDAWEIWNEPDLMNPGSGYDPGMPAATFGTMLKSAVAAIRPVSSKPIVSGGLGNGQISYLQSAASAVGGLPTDAVGIHPYGLRAPDNWPNSGWGFGNMSTYLNQAWTAFGKPVWVTEVGITDKTVLPDYLSNVYSLCANQFAGKVPVVLWYCWSDGMGRDWGLVDGAGNPKNTYTRFQSIAPAW